MALPSITLPRGLPAWQSAGHAVELLPLYADVPMSTGAPRKRRLYRSAPRIVSVALELSAAQMRAFFDWYEGPLMQGGAAAFAAQAPDQGPRGLLWWEAQFETPPTYEARPRGRWRLTARLRLTGEGTPEPPPVPDLASSVVVAVRASAALHVGKPLASEAVAAWLPSTRFASEAVAAWLAAAPTRLPLASEAVAAWLASGAVEVPASYVLREDGGRLLREDGGRMTREA